jgi:hypothetical protein
MRRIRVQSPQSIRGCGKRRSRTKDEGRGPTTTIGDSGCDDGDLEYLGGDRNENQRRDVVFSGMPRAFESVYRYDIDTDFLGRDGVPNGRALVT